jgi:hypothetical protein
MPSGQLKPPGPFAWQDASHILNQAREGGDFRFRVPAQHIEPMQIFHRDIGLILPNPRPSYYPFFTMRFMPSS